MNPMNASVFRSTSACVEIKGQDSVVVTATVVLEVERNLEDQERSPVDRTVMPEAITAMTLIEHGRGP